MNVLDRIVESTRTDVHRRRRQVPLAELERQLAARGHDRPFQEALARPGISVIAEHKRRSPSVGEIREGATVTLCSLDERARVLVDAFARHPASFPAQIHDELLVEVAPGEREAVEEILRTQMRGAVERLEAIGVPCTLFDRLTGLTATDALVALLMRLSGKPAPARVKRQRGQLQDAMLDGHFHLGGKRVAILLLREGE